MSALRKLYDHCMEHSSSSKLPKIKDIHKRSGKVAKGIATSIEEFKQINKSMSAIHGRLNLLTIELEGDLKLVDFMRSELVDEEKANDKLIYDIEKLVGKK